MFLELTDQWIINAAHIVAIQRDNSGAGKIFVQRADPAVAATVPSEVPISKEKFKALVSELPIKLIVKK